MTEEKTPDATERIEVQRMIPADAARIFALLCDPQGHVTIDSSGMLQDATGEPATKVDDEFVVHMDREALNDYPLGKYDVTIHITRFEPHRAIAWTILGQLNLGHVYGYELEPTEGGTIVTLLLRLVGHRAPVEGGQHLPRHFGDGAAGHARHPRPHAGANEPVVRET
jgi:hypothetical protein